MLVGEKVVLRAMRREDIEKTRAWRDDMELRGLAMFHPFPVTDELEQDWIDGVLKDKSNRTVTFAMEEKSTKNFVGYVQLKNIDWISRNCSFGIVIGEESARGKGFGKEALGLVLDYAFNMLNLEKITLYVVKANQRAIKLYQDTGFVTEGELKKHFFWNGEYHGVLIMSAFRQS